MAAGARAAAGGGAPLLRAWADLRAEAEATETGRRFSQSDAQRNAGLLPHTDAKIRYFSENRATPRVKLYRDQAAWCPYCQKVWLLLEEKQVDYAIEKVPMRSYGDKPAEFLRKVPRGILPAVELDGQMMTESMDIMVAIENMFPDPGRPMIPPAGPDRDKALELLQLERQLFGLWCQYLFRPEARRSITEFEAGLGKVDAVLASGDTPWFLNYSHPTLVDMQYVSHVERMIASALYCKGFDIRARFQGIDRWLTTFETLPHYMASKSDHYTHCMNIPPQYGEPHFSSNEAARRIRNSLEPSSARLPVLWDADMEPRTKAQEEMPEADHRIEAAWAMAKNGEAITRFACRAAGKDVGAWARNNPTKCELSDPGAKAGEFMIPVVGALLRGVTASLLAGDGGPEQAAALKAAVEAEAGCPSKGGWGQAVACIEYLRDRVGVPRDMQMPAAKLLRAHLGEVAATLGTAE